MAKYTFELKLKLVKEYLLGVESYSSLARKYGLNDKSTKVQIRQWVNAYQQFGEEGLMRKRKNEIYPVQFKLDAIELYLTSEMSIREVANHLGMNNPPLISAWLKVYRTEGIEGLSAQRGCPKVNQSGHIISEIEKVESSSIEPEVKTESLTMSENKEVAEHIKELERQIRLLKIENEYLKELRRLRNAQKPKSNESISTIIHNLRGSFQLNEILEAVKFPKSTYMYWQKRFGRPDPDEKLKQLIRDIRAAHKDYGHKRVKMELLKRGYVVNKKKVQRL